MNLEKLLGENLKGLTERVGHFGGLSSLNPFESYQVINKYPSSSSLSSGSSSSSIVASNPYSLSHGHGGIIDHSNDHQMLSEIASKYATSGTGSGYGQTEMESHYGPPQISAKEDKLKGAALSALTFLAFLFFLNILQSCMKEHIDAMNPGVTVMAGQRSTLLINRNGDENDEILRTQGKLDKIDKFSSKYSELNQEHEHDDDDSYRDDVADEYEYVGNEDNIIRYESNLSETEKRLKQSSNRKNRSKHSKKHRRKKTKNLKMKSQSIS